ncbi:hypothetical protein [Streptomyces bicolor]|uniref:hypothetical protein n=1 Tax=Streptomyces bicolor TaxID=66874 RepID=UPI000A3EEAA7|nr:hypothetical protein [Streptomyces bicolor]
MGKVIAFTDQEKAELKPLHGLGLARWDAISRSITSHTCRARGGASAAANTAMICW